MVMDQIGPVTAWTGEDEEETVTEVTTAMEHLPPNIPPPATTGYHGNIPTPTIQGNQPNAMFSNTTKTYNNWEMCYTCGWDVEKGHNSATCVYKKNGHQDGCNRQNAQAYMDAGHRVSKRAMHKVNLPVNTGPDQT